MVIALIIVALALVACAPKPPSVSQSQFEAARQEAIDAENQRQALEREKSQLQEELHARQLLLEVLREMAEELE
jgi:uncharacterized lipoprotein YmbA